jgi:hypothetical protein
VSLVVNELLAWFLKSSKKHDGNSRAGGAFWVWWTRMGNLIANRIHSWRLPINGVAGLAPRMSLPAGESVSKKSAVSAICAFPFHSVLFRAIPFSE